MLGVASGGKCRLAIEMKAKQHFIAVIGAAFSRSPQCSRRAPRTKEVTIERIGFVSPQ
jgi:hypothetical protein